MMYYGIKYDITAEVINHLTDNYDFNYFPQYIRVSRNIYGEQRSTERFYLYSLYIISFEKVI